MDRFFSLLFGIFGISIDYQLYLKEKKSCNILFDVHINDYVTLQRSFG